MEEWADIEIEIGWGAGEAVATGIEPQYRALQFSLSSWISFICTHGVKTRGCASTTNSKQVQEQLLLTPDFRAAVVHSPYSNYTHIQRLPVKGH